MKYSELTKYGIKFINVGFSTTPLEDKFTFHLEFSDGEVIPMEFKNLQTNELYLIIFSMRNYIINKHCS